eukprot:sb/3464634/
MGHNNADACHTLADEDPTQGCLRRNSFLKLLKKERLVDASRRDRSFNSDVSRRQKDVRGVPDGNDKLRIGKHHITQISNLKRALHITARGAIQSIRHLPGATGDDGVKLNINSIKEPTDTSKQPIRARYLGQVTGYQPIRDQYFLIRWVHARYKHSRFRNFLIDNGVEMRLLFLATLLDIWGTGHGSRDLKPKILDYHRDPLKSSVFTQRLHRLNTVVTPRAAGALWVCPHKPAMKVVIFFCLVAAAVSIQCYWGSRTKGQDFDELVEAGTIMKSNCTTQEKCYITYTSEVDTNTYSCGECQDGWAGDCAECDTDLLRSSPAAAQICSFMFGSTVPRTAPRRRLAASCRPKKFLNFQMLVTGPYSYTKSMIQNFTNPTHLLLRTSFSQKSMSSLSSLSSKFSESLSSSSSSLRGISPSPANSLPLELYSLSFCHGGWVILVNNQSELVI